MFCGENVTDISLFASSDQTKFVKLGPNADVPIDQVLSNDQTVCYLEEKCDYNACWPVKRNDVEIGKVYGDSQDNVGTVKL